MLLDAYFRRPVLWDSIISGICVGTTLLCLRANYIHVPAKDQVASTVSDMSTVSLTCAGFILTLVTLLISFKSTSSVDPEKAREDNKPFDLFFASGYYKRTIDLLNNAIKVLAIVAMLGYSLKLLLSDRYCQYLLFYCVFAVAIIFLTIWRCVLILSKIVKIQNHDTEEHGD